MNPNRKHLFLFACGFLKGCMSSENTCLVLLCLRGGICLWRQFTAQSFFLNSYPALSKARVVLRRCLHLLHGGKKWWQTFVFHVHKTAAMTHKYFGKCWMSRAMSLISRCHSKRIYFCHGVHDNIQNKRIGKSSKLSYNQMTFISITRPHK